MNRHTDDFLSGFYDINKTNNNDNFDNVNDLFNHRSPGILANDSYYDNGTLANFSLNKINDSPKFLPTAPSFSDLIPSTSFHMNDYPFYSQFQLPNLNQGINTMPSFPSFQSNQMSHLVPPQAPIITPPTIRNTPIFPTLNPARSSNISLLNNSSPLTPQNSMGILNKPFFDISSISTSINNQAICDYNNIKNTRLRKNRESARQSRSRKKEYLETLKDKYSSLHPYLFKMRQQTIESYSKLVSKEIYSDHSIEGIKKKFNLIKFLLDMYFDTLLPFYAKFHISMCLQSPEFYENGSKVTIGELNIKKEIQYDKPNIHINDVWSRIVSYLLLTNEQEFKLRTMFLNNKKKDSNKLSTYSEKIQELKIQLCDLQNYFNQDFGQIHSILTPTQAKELHKFTKVHISQISKYLY